MKVIPDKAIMEHDDHSRCHDACARDDQFAFAPKMPPASLGLLQLQPVGSIGCHLLPKEVCTTTYLLCTQCTFLPVHAVGSWRDFGFLQWASPTLATGPSLLAAAAHKRYAILLHTTRLANRRRITVLLRFDACAVLTS